MFRFNSSFIFFSIFISTVYSTTVCPTFKDYFTFYTNKNCYDNPDGDAQNSSTIIKLHGYQSKTYNITTEDGYIISVERLQGNKQKSTPIIIGPGIYMNSFAFVNRGNKSLAFFLADQGYQVWIINWRGTKFSKTHKYLSPKDLEYWKMGFQKMAEFDLKSTMEKVMEETENKGIYLGFSMGTTIGLIFNIKQQNTAESTLKGLVHMAPVARLEHSTSILKYLYPLWPLGRPIIKKFFHGEISFFEGITAKCGKHPFLIILCEFLIFPIFGNSYKSMDPLTLPVTSKQNRESASFKTINHYYRIMKNHKFVEMENGEDSKEPKEFDLKKLSLYQSMLVGGRDILATVKDSKWLYENIPEGSKCGYTLIEKYGHTDFMNSKDVDEVLFDKVLKHIERIDRNECNKE